MMTEKRDPSKEFYDAHYQGDRYAAYASPEAHPFQGELSRLLSQVGREEGKWLEVGCGRGLLQDMVVDYTGVDISETVTAFLRKPFHCAPAEAMPFQEDQFDGVWSYAVLEHVEDPERAMAEMRRVLKPGGILFLSPAWQCRPWAGRDYAWKPFRELSWPDRIRKAFIPLRNSVAVRSLTVLPRRLCRLAGFFLRQAPTRFHSRPLEPNYANYHIADADARHHMDPFEAILWFRSRGDRVRSHPNWWQALTVRNGTLVVEIRKQDLSAHSPMTSPEPRELGSAQKESSSYRHGKEDPCNTSYIRPIVLRFCREQGARRILDIGCGNGWLCRELVDAGFRVVGMEPSPSGIALARERVPEGMFYETGVDAEFAEVPEDDFDLVVSTEVVEHLYTPRLLPRWAYAKLKAGGILVVSAPYHGFLKNLAIVLANQWDFHHSPEWDGGHIKFWSRRSLTHLLETNGFRVLEFHGAGRLTWLWKSMVLVARKEPEIQE